MAAEKVEALVQIGAVETRYQRAGQGTPLILLRAQYAGADPLFERLATEFKVIAPELSSCRAASGFEDWLRGLIDGLGLDQPRVVVAAESVQELWDLMDGLRD